MNHNHGDKKHGILMVLCCMILVVAIFILPSLGFGSGLINSSSPSSLFGIFFIVHIGMMVFMMRGKKNKDQDETATKKQNQ